MTTHGYPSSDRLAADLTPPPRGPAPGAEPAADTLARIAADAREAALLDVAGRFADHHRVTYTGAEVAGILRLIAAHPD